MTFGKIQPVTLGPILDNSSVIDFVRFLLKESYSYHFPDKKEEAQQMVDEVFDSLVSHREKGDTESQLEKVSSELYQSVFRGGDPDFWFNKRYHHYKSSTKPQAELSILKGHILGKKVLDFGSGLGFLAYWLNTLDYTVFSTDVLEYQSNNVSHIPFVKMSSPDYIPFDTGEIDTTIIKTVLHHIDATFLDEIVAELFRVSKRVVVIEDISVVDVDSVLKNTKNTEKFTRFIHLSENEKLSSCILNDYYGNAIVQGISEMSFPFEFRSIDDWISLFEKHGFSTIESKVLGFPDYNLHGFLQVVMVFEKE